MVESKSLRLILAPDHSRELLSIYFEFPIRAASRNADRNVRTISEDSGKHSHQIELFETKTVLFRNSVRRDTQFFIPQYPSSYNAPDISVRANLPYPIQDRSILLLKYNIQAGQRNVLGHSVP